MKKSISTIINELGLATFDEIVSILKEHSGEVKKRTLFSKLKGMEDENIIFKVLSDENSYGVEGYISGPNMDAEDDFEIKRILIERGLSARDVQGIDWRLFSSRVLNGLMGELKTLQEDLEKVYDDPKSIEMRYFDLSIKYHELYGFFFDMYGADFLIPVEALLNDCREAINKKEF
jgi:hypothetical protein